jgi:hypothetical protein
MKKIPTVIVFLIFGLGLQAQTWDEWFKQRKTQRKYLAQQIVALQFYLGYLEKGYEIASAGLNAINSIKNGDFNLHNGFFNSLKWVKPSIRNSAAVADIILMQRQIVKCGKLVIELAEGSNQFTSAEVVSLKQVADRLLEDCAGSIDELVRVITSGELEMKDDERMRRIEKLRANMEGQYRFCRSFADETGQLVMQRKVEQLEIDRSGKIFGLN